MISQPAYDQDKVFEHQKNVKWWSKYLVWFGYSTLAWGTLTVFGVMC